MKRLLVWLDRIMKKRKELKRWQRVVTVLAAVITFATTYALILPAITVERDNTEAGFRVKKELPSTIHEGLVQTQYADAPFYYKAYIRDKTKDESHYHLYIPNENTNQPPYTASEPYYETIVQKDDGSLETQKTDIVWKDIDNGIFVVNPGL